MRGARLGLVVPKRVLKRAVDRNRVKRQIREAFRLARPTLPPWDIVVVVMRVGDVGHSVDRLMAMVAERGSSAPSSGGTKPE